MASSSGSGHSAFGLGRKKKGPGLMDQISKIFAGDKKKRSKGSFRSHAASPQQSSTRRKQHENAVVKFFRNLVATSPRPKSRWRDVLGLNDSLRLDDFETARLFMTQHRHHRLNPKEQNPQCDDAKSRAHCPDSSACDTAFAEEQ
ncbi:uncharacterized protein mbpa isoform X2 [Eucyclogobius newberryi]|uniref:uncharacterized protein mbpa isoform X2 n=1 Tax=Eucyclogobius newberryi TaxID=166745 RepID=UPI003B58FD58